MSDKMDGIFIFDQQNDVIFIKANDKMKKKLHQMCKQQELISSDAVSDFFCEQFMEFNKMF